MSSTMNIHWGKSVTVGQLETCGDDGLTIFRRIIVEDEAGQKFELTVFGNTVINNMENTNEQQ